MTEDIVQLELCIKSLVKAIDSLNDTVERNTETLQKWLDLEEEEEETDSESDFTPEDDQDMDSESASQRNYLTRSVKRRKLLSDIGH